uniref:hypothetical protein n=1 Tax=Paenibacillus tepidiphilus TaxID=2608683 RepID=UPI00193D7705
HLENGNGQRTEVHNFNSLSGLIQANLKFNLYIVRLFYFIIHGLTDGRDHEKMYACTLKGCKPIFTLKAAAVQKG